MVGFGRVRRYDMVEFPKICMDGERHLFWDEMNEEQKNAYFEYNDRLRFACRERERERRGSVAVVSSADLVFDGKEDAIEELRRKALNGSDFSCAYKILLMERILDRLPKPRTTG
jgi:hypothetical protein